MSLINLLVSDDGRVISMLNSIHQAIDGIGLDICSSIEDAGLSFSRSNLVIGIVHVSRETSEEQVVRLFHQRQQLEHPLPLLLIANEDVPPQLLLKLLRLGAIDCLRLPCEESKLAFMVESLTVRRRFANEDRISVSQKNEIKMLPPLSLQAPAFLYRSEVMRRVIDKVRRVADRESVVLLGGETGTGKTRIARLIHDQSCRKTQPFVHIDCASIPQGLIENELFGHQKGAFTSAESISEGRCAAAKSGTLFLDEIDAISPKAQSTLLRLADERRYSPVGGTKDIELKARLIVGTNRDLAEEVEAGRFRKDLYYRLKVLSIDVPPLRDRKEEIKPLTEFFLKHLAEQQCVPVPHFEPKAWDALLEYQWPGNIRELKNTVEQVMAFSEGPLLRWSDLPVSISSAYLSSAHSTNLPEESVLDDVPDVQSKKGFFNVGDSWILRRFPDMNSIGIGRIQGEVRAIISALTRAHNNRTMAAEMLGISREALYKKLRKYDLMDFRIQ